MAMNWAGQAAEAMRILRAVLNGNESALMLTESYFDETNTHSADKRLCVGGYVFLSDAAEDQARRWLANNDRWGLPYFHMVECAHNTGVYAHLTKDECDLAAREAIKIIKETASHGVCVTVLEADYDELMPPMNFLGSAYDHCARAVITGVANWAEMSQSTGDMHYVFEFGTNTQAAASVSILEMMRDAEIRREARYAGHTFIEKKKSPGVQAADLLAWHAGQDCARAERGDRMRKDFRSLIEIPHTCLHSKLRSPIEDPRGREWFSPDHEAAQPYPDKTPTIRFLGRDRALPLAGPDDRPSACETESVRRGEADAKKHKS